MGIKLNISEDYKCGQISFDCQSLGDIRIVGDIISNIGFAMRFANIQQGNNMELPAILQTLNNKVENVKDYIDSLEYKNFDDKKYHELKKLLMLLHFRYLPEMQMLIKDAERLMNLRNHD